MTSWPQLSQRHRKQSGYSSKLTAFSVSRTATKDGPAAPLSLRRKTFVSPCALPIIWKLLNFAEVFACRKQHSMAKVWIVGDLVIECADCDHARDHSEFHINVDQRMLEQARLDLGDIWISD